MTLIPEGHSINEILEILGPLKDLATEMHDEDVQFFDKICTYLSYNVTDNKQISIDLTILKEVIELLHEKVHIVGYLNYLMESMNTQDDQAMKSWFEEIKPKHIARKFWSPILPSSDLEKEIGNA
jgi:hypothetical protein